MPLFESPCLSLAISQLKASGSGHYAVWVIKAPYPGGYVHHDCIWSETLTQLWQSWQELFSLRGLPSVPKVSTALQPPIPVPQPQQPLLGVSKSSYGGRLMQHLGISLWQWLFDGAIQSSLDQSQGIAMGANRELRLRLEIRDSDLVALPWEIMQPQAGKQAISLSQQVLFSRTTSDVDPLLPQRISQVLRILLVLGQDVDGEPVVAASGKTLPAPALKLEQE